MCVCVFVCVKKSDEKLATRVQAVGDPGPRLKLAEILIVVLFVIYLLILDQRTRRQEGGPALNPVHFDHSPNLF